jgi:hypothetical protein
MLAQYTHDSPHVHDSTHCVPLTSVVEGDGDGELRAVAAILAVVIVAGAALGL